MPSSDACLHHGFAGEIAGRVAFGQILQVDQREPLGIFLQVVHRVGAGQQEMIGIQLVGDEIRLGFRQQHIKQISGAGRHKLEAVRMIAELKAGGFELRARSR